jgi:hypothetical protein
VGGEVVVPEVATLTLNNLNHGISNSAFVKSLLSVFCKGSKCVCQ